MAKTRTVYVCQNCGAESPKWVGNCSACGEWNTYAEEIITKEKKQTLSSTTSTETSAKPQLIHEIKAEDLPRFSTNDAELNRVLGGGIVPGSLVLIGGEPGIGKSTLMLQLALSLRGKRVLYVSGEESTQQIKMRAERTDLNSQQCYLLAETSLDQVFTQIKNVGPDILIIDSIQTLHKSGIESAPGSVTQVRECSAELLRYAKDSNVPVFLIGHINKEGSIAGPKILEHMVDTVLQFEGDRNHVFRLLRAVKNRFGSTNELGVYEMYAKGLKEVSNPSEIFIHQRDQSHSGTTVSCIMEGLRPIMIETQALVSTAAYGTPQRSATGFDLRRLSMLLAVLEKRCGFKLAAKDVFLNIAGGIRSDDPATDLAVVSAVLSSNADIPVNPKYAFAGEVGLSGEIRPVNRIEKRISEAEKLGFEKIFVSSYNLKGISKTDYRIDIFSVSQVGEVFGELFG